MRRRHSLGAGRPAVALEGEVRNTAVAPDGMDPAQPDYLREGAARLGVPLDTQAQSRLEAYLDLLQRWGRTYNLTAILDRPTMRVQHLMDSLALLPHLEPLPAARSPVLLDVGSGAGLPGVVVAIAHPGRQVVCVDTVAKKVGFIRQVAAELRLPNLHAVHARVEMLAGDPGWQRLASQGADQIVSRAFASLDDFLHGTQGLLRPDGVWLALKGQVPSEEIDRARTAAEQGRWGGVAGGWRFEVVPLQVPGLAAQRCLVRVQSGDDVPRETR